MGQPYRVEELLAIRQTVSESAVSLDRFGDAQAIKEHVLRPTASAPGFSYNSENTPPGNISSNPDSETSIERNDRARLSAAPLNLPVQAVSGTAAAYKKASPTPSVKRGKAERLIKEHGSPPGMRVTAGGRVVPSDIPPLSGPYTHSRFSHNRTTDNNTFMPDLSGYIPPGQIVCDPFGNLLQNVRGHLLPVKYFEGFPQTSPPFLDYSAAMGATQSQLMPFGNAFGNGHAINLSDNSNPPVAVADPYYVHGEMTAPHHNNIDQSQPAANGPPRERRHYDESVGLDIATQIEVLEKEYKKKDKERKELEKAGVLRCDAMSAEEKKQLVERKVKFVKSLDQIRKSIKTLKAAQENEANNHQPTTQNSSEAYVHTHGLLPASLSALNGFAQIPSQFVNAHPLAVDAYFPGQWGPHHSMQLHADRPDADPAAHSGLVGQIPTNEVHVAEGRAATTSGRDHGSAEVSPSEYIPATRKRSYALEIKKPIEQSRDRDSTSKKVLDPTSPNYEPTMSKSFGKAATKFAGSSTPLGPSPTRQFSIMGNADFNPSPAWINEPSLLPAGMLLAGDHASLRKKQSGSSHGTVGTADFFPHNTHEHSLNRNQYKSSLPADVLHTPGNDTGRTAQSGGIGEYRKRQTVPPGFSALSAPLGAQYPRVSSWNRDIIPPLEPVRAPQGNSSANTSRQNSSTPEAAGTSAGHDASRNVSGSAVVHNQEVQNYSSLFLRGFKHGVMREPLWSRTDEEYIRGYSAGLTGGDPVGPDESNVKSSKETKTQDSTNSRARRSEDSLPQVKQAPRRSTEINKGRGPSSYNRVSGTKIVPASAVAQQAQTASQTTMPNRTRDRSSETTVRNLQENVGGASAGSSIKSATGHTQSSQRHARFQPNETGDKFLQPNAAILRARQSSQYDGAVDDYGDPMSRSNPNRRDAAKGPRSSVNSPTEFSGVSSNPSSARAGSSSPEKSSSPSKSSKNRSPTKARLEKLASRLRGGKKHNGESIDSESNFGPETLSPSSKQRRKESWRARFSEIKKEEDATIAEYKKNNPL